MFISVISFVTSFNLRERLVLAFILAKKCSKNEYKLVSWVIS